MLVSKASSKAKSRYISLVYDDQPKNAVRAIVNGKEEEINTIVSKRSHD
jgi:hypothetical protein